MTGEAWTDCVVDDIKAPLPNAVATGPFGSAISSRFFVESGIPVIRGGNLSQDIGVRLSDEGLVFLDKEKAREFLRSFARRGDLIFTCWGTIDQVGLIDKRSRFSEYIVSNKQMKLTPDPDRTDSLFLYYIFSNPSMRAQILNCGIGSSVPGFNLGQLKSIKFRLPPLSEQRAIAHILGTLDDKIEINRKMNETLEGIARALFKSWFVDFDPVRAKAEDLIRERVLEIGDGYRAKNSELGAPGLPFIRAGDLDNGFDCDGAEILCQASVEKAGPKVCRVGDVAFTSKGTIGRFARVTEQVGRFVYSPQVCYWRSIDSSRLRSSLLYCWMVSDDLKAQIDSVAGQTDMAPYVSLQDQRAMTVPLFPAAQHTVADRLDVILARQAAGRAESKNLSLIRDTLLPKLISGEIRVKDAERFVEQAL